MRIRVKIPEWAAEEDLLEAIRWYVSRFPYVPSCPEAGRLRRAGPRRAVVLTMPEDLYARLVEIVAKCRLNGERYTWPSVLTSIAAMYREAIKRPS